jgi:uncharacterized integral membrane protein (TIGR00697 family)
MNELIFLVYCSFLAVACSVATYLGREALVSCLCLQFILANLLLSKTITLFGLTATASDALAVGSMLCLNLIQEYYGKETAQRAIIISMSAGVLYMIVTQLHLAYQPSVFDICHPHFAILLNQTPRLIAASYATYFIIQKLEIVLYGYLQRLFHHSLFWFRNICSLLITQLCDTTLFTFLGLYGTISQLGEIIVISYALKIISIVTLVPLTSFIITIIKK